MKLKGEHILLRAVEPADIDVLYQWENDELNWKVSNTLTPFSRNVLEQYIESAQLDIYSQKQLRLIICTTDLKAIGTIDLYDFEPNHLRAGIGILIAEQSERKKGHAYNALQLLIDYCFEILDLHQLYCSVTIDNEDSILLFQKHNFQITGIKKEWVRDGGKYKDELLLQLIKK